MTYTALPLFLGVAALAVYLLAAGLRPRLPAALRVGGLALLAVAALVAHTRWVDRGADGRVRLQRPLPHLNEFWHYYVGTKYFAELGYRGLYAAGVVADHEDDPEGFQPDAPVRDLATYRTVSRGSVLADAERIKAPFSTARWERFKRDVALLRGWTRPGFWQQQGYSLDHGYNATPLVTALLGGLAAQPWLDSAAFVDVVRWADLYLVVLLGVVVAALEGAAAGLTLVFFVLVNPLNDYGFTGGAYLRTPWLICLALALLALRQGWRATAGALFALSGWMRIFPLVVPTLLLLRDLVPRDRAARLRGRARLHVAFALTSLAVLAGTSFVPTPDGANPWRAFAENMALHAGTPGANQIGLQVPFRYSAGSDSGELSRPGWRDEVARLLHERRIAYRLCAAALVALALASLRRARDAQVLLPGLLLIVAALPLAHYYWAVLGIVPLAVGWDRRIQLLLAGALLTLSITVLPLFWRDAQDLRFTWLSLQVIAFLLAACALLPGARPRGRAALVALCACGVLACSAESPTSAPDLATGDVWRSRAVGLTLEKPPDWIFLPGSSLRADPPERIRDLAGLWELLDNPGEVPLVRLAPTADDGAPEFHAYLIPPLAKEKPWVMERFRQMDLVALIETNVGNRMRWPDYAQLEPAEPTRIGGLDAATILIAYRDQEGDGSGPRLVERRWVARDDLLFFFFKGIAAEPVSDETRQGFEQILASVRFDG